MNNWEWWKCQRCGASNHMREDKAPCLCGEPQPDAESERRHNEEVSKLVGIMQVFLQETGFYDRKKAAR